MLIKRNKLLNVTPIVTYRKVDRSSILFLILWYSVSFIIEADDIFLQGRPCDLVTGEERKFALGEGNPCTHISCTVEMTNLNISCEYRYLITSNREIHLSNPSIKNNFLIKW